ncbi:MAG: hypothetical protein RLZZ283_609 [Candidatus Parcubacteria bacterium]
MRDDERTGLSNNGNRERWYWFLKARGRYNPHPRTPHRLDERYRTYMRDSAAQYVRRERRVAEGMPPTQPLLPYEPERTMMSDTAYYDFIKNKK